jgi:hypothetical protein
LEPVFLSGAACKIFHRKEKDGAETLFGNFGK